MLCEKRRFSFCLFCKFRHAGNVFADDVEFEVDGCSYLNGMEIGVVVGVWDNANLEGVGCGIADGEADAVDCD